VFPEPAQSGRREGVTDATFAASAVVDILHAAASPHSSRWFRHRPIRHRIGEAGHCRRSWRFLDHRQVAAAPISV